MYHKQIFFLKCFIFAILFLAIESKKKGFNPPAQDPHIETARVGADTQKPTNSEGGSSSYTGYSGNAHADSYSGKAHADNGQGNNHNLVGRTIKTNNEGGSSSHTAYSEPKQAYQGHENSHLIDNIHIKSMTAVGCGEHTQAFCLRRVRPPKMEQYLCLGQGVDIRNIENNYYAKAYDFQDFCLRRTYFRHSKPSAFSDFPAKRFGQDMPFSPDSQLAAGSDKNKAEGLKPGSAQQLPPATFLKAPETGGLKPGSAAMLPPATFPKDPEINHTAASSTFSRTAFQGDPNVSNV